jgi:hypothetical protein
MPAFVGVIPGMPRNETSEVRLSDTEKAANQGAAERVGLAVSTWAGMLLSREAQAG